MESFSLKPNAKRLILKPKTSNNIIGTGGGGSTPNTPNRQKSQLLNINSSRNESFNGEIPLEKNLGSGPSTSNSAATPNSANSYDNGRRESWLHPNNLEKVRQQNLHTTDSILNNTLSDLVPRKPIETHRLSGNKSSNNTSLSIENTSVCVEDVATPVSRRETIPFSDSIVESFSSKHSSTLGEERPNEDQHQETIEAHPTGITLRRVGFVYIIYLFEHKVNYFLLDIIQFLLWMNLNLILLKMVHVLFRTLQLVVKVMVMFTSIEK